MDSIDEIESICSCSVEVSLDSGGLVGILHKIEDIASA